MSKLAGLKGAKSLNDLADLLDFRPKAVSFILYKEPNATKYTTFQIPKRKGGQRTIKAPIEKLKLLQRRLSDLLQDCVDELNSTKKRRDRVAHGFKRERSIITNARRHRRRRWVFNLDLEEFFPSINFGRVRGFFLKSRDFELHEKVATVIAQIACHDNALPQGSPCSPVISNLVGHLLDMRLVRLATTTGCTYSRYADDITFSTNKRQFPADIAVPSSGEGAASHLWVPGQALRKVIERSGFLINAKKTQLMYRSSRQEVTGLVVNEKIGVRWEYRQNVRAMVHSLVKTGGFEVLGMVPKEGGAVIEKRPGTLDELHGMLGFIESIDRCNKPQAARERSEKQSSREKVYRTFLIYSIFYAAPAPVIICEGETDNIYLTHAIRSLSAEFPDLAEVTADKGIRLKVRLYKYTRSSTARLLGLRDGGASGLKTFVIAYHKETERFGGPRPTSPVVVLYDNDDGAKDIRSAIRGISGKKVDESAAFVRVSENMFAVPIPGEAPSRIEGLFDGATKATVVAGKTFNDGKGIDPDKHYGKTVFAKEVVRAKADAIDFTGFRPLLERLVAVIASQKTSSSTPAAPA
jgi:retron-type reverse transcriptase